MNSFPKLTQRIEPNSRWYKDLQAFQDSLARQDLEQGEHFVRVDSSKPFEVAADDDLRFHLISRDLLKATSCLLQSSPSIEELSSAATLSHAVLNSLTADPSGTTLEQLWMAYNQFEYVAEALTACLNELDDCEAVDECDHVISIILKEAEQKLMTEAIKLHVSDKVKEELAEIPVLNAIGENEATMIQARDIVLRIEAIIKQTTELSKKYLSPRMSQNYINNKAFPSLVDVAARYMIDSADDLSINSADVVAKLVKRIQQAFPEELPCLKKLEMLQKYYRFGLGEIVDDLTERAAVRSSKSAKPSAKKMRKQGFKQSLRHEVPEEDRHELSASDIEWIIVSRFEDTELRKKTLGEVAKLVKN